MCRGEHQSIPSDYILVDHFCSSSRTALLLNPQKHARTHTHTPIYRTRLLYGRPNALIIFFFSFALVSLMVYLIASHPSLCGTLDRIIDHSGAAASASRDEFLSEAIAQTVSALPPSQLLDALWLYLTLYRECLLISSTTPTTATPTQPDASGTCPEKEAEKESQDGDRTTDEDPPRQHAEDKDREEAQFARLRERVYALWDAASGADDQLEVLLRQQQELMRSATSSSTTAATASSSSAEKTITSTTATTTSATTPSAVAAVDLALDAFRTPRRATALLRPATLRLLLRRLDALWLWKYLCKVLRWRLDRRLDTLNGPAWRPSASTKKTKEARRVSNHDMKSSNGLSAEEFFHDYEVVLPVSVVQRWIHTLSPTPSGGAVATDSSSASSAATRESHPPSSTLTQLLSQCSAGSVQLIINPAVSAAVPNPMRVRKNKRVEVIQDAAMDYQYRHLTGGTAAAGTATTATGRDVGSNPSTHLAVLLAEQMKFDDHTSHAFDDPQQQQQQFQLAERQAAQRQSHASFLKDVSIGLDIQVMSLSGAGVGYYLGHLRGASVETCALYAVVGLVVMLLVDGLLLLIRMRRQDERVALEKKRVRQQRLKMEKEAELLAAAMSSVASATARVKEDNAPVEVEEERERTAMEKKQQ